MIATLLVSGALASELGFGDAIRLATDASPSARIVASEAERDRADARTAAAWPNPAVALREEPEQAGLEASVPVDVGAIARAGGVAPAVDAADVREQAGRAAVGAAAGAAWLDARRATDRATVSGEAQDLAGRLAEAAERRVAAGEWSADEGALVRADAARALDEALSWQLEARNAVGRLAALLAASPDDLSLAGWPEVPSPPSPDPAQVPAVLAADLEAREALASLRAERIGLFPVISVDGGWLFRGPVGPVWGASVELPLFAPGNARVNAASARSDAAGARADLARLDAATAVRAATDEMATAEKLASAWDIPGLDDALAATTRRFDAGELALVDYLARRDLALRARQGAIDARWRLDRARLAAWELAGRLPPESR